MPFIWKLLHLRHRGQQNPGEQPSSTPRESDAEPKRQLTPTRSKKSLRTPFRRSSRPSPTPSSSTLPETAAATISPEETPSQLSFPFEPVQPLQSSAATATPDRQVSETPANVVSERNLKALNSERSTVKIGMGRPPLGRNVTPILPVNTSPSPTRRASRGRYSLSSAVSVGRSSCSSVVDATSRFRRMLREAWNGTVTSGRSERSLDDVPDLGDELVLKRFSLEADASIASYAREQQRQSATDAVAVNSIEGDDGVGVDRGLMFHHPSAPRMPDEVPGGVVFNDGMVSFIVPPEWVAMKSDDCVLLYSGRCFGYVRSVKANLATQSLLETDRLQVMSHVYALSSPVLDHNFASIRYASPLGTGEGIALFKDGFEGGAAVFGICGPTDERKVIEETVAHLKREVNLVTEPKNISGKRLDLVVKSATPTPLHASFESLEFSGAAGKEDIDVDGNGTLLYEVAKEEPPGEGMCSVQ